MMDLTAGVHKIYNVIVFSKVWFILTSTMLCYEDVVFILIYLYIPMPEVEACELEILLFYNNCLVIKENIAGARIEFRIFGLKLSKIVISM
jgi:hypothetical protein